MCLRESLFRQASAPQAWARACNGLHEAAALNAAQSGQVCNEQRGTWPAHLADPHPAVLTGLQIFLAALHAYTCPIKVTGFSAGSYTGAVMVILLVHRRAPFQVNPHYPLGRLPSRPKSCSYWKLRPRAGLWEQSSIMRLTSCAYGTHHRTVERASAKGWLTAKCALCGLSMAPSVKAATATLIWPMSFPGSYMMKLITISRNMMSRTWSMRSNKPSSEQLCLQWVVWL